MALNLVFPYSADKTLAMVNGVPMVGLTGNEAVLIEPLSDAAVSSVGLDRSVSVSNGIDDRVKVTIKLQQGSPSNDVLNGFYQVIKIRGLAFAAINIQNLFERSILIAPQGWFLRLPNQGYAAEAGERVWVFECLPTVQNLGGAF